MKNIDWTKFKQVSEKLFRNVELENNCYGYQIQKETKWNRGLTSDEINQFENQFGFKFPHDYVQFLKLMNGFDKEEIYIDPEGVKSNVYSRRCYKYPEDFQKVSWLIEEVNEYIEYAKQALEENGFKNFEIEGFVPFYGHRALVVLKDKSLSPVLSICESDIIVYGKDLFSYLTNEFYINIDDL